MELEKNRRIPYPILAKWWLLRATVLSLGLLALGGCKAKQMEAPALVPADAPDASANLEDARMWMTVGERRFAITLADTEAARAFVALLPLTMDMPDLNGNEKHADVSNALPAQASRPGTIRKGDLMLYGSNTIVVFYEGFSSSYSYTRLGRVDDTGDLAQILGSHSVRVTFTAN